MSYDHWKLRSDFDEAMRRGQAPPDLDEYDLSVCPPCGAGHHSRCMGKSYYPPWGCDCTLCSDRVEGNNHG